MFFRLGKSRDADSDKRKGQRASFFQSSYFMPVSHEIEPEVCECWVSNISEGGLAFETGLIELKKGDEIKVLYKIGAQMRNDYLKVQFAGRVLDKYRYGCAFIESDENRKLMIDQYVKNNPDQL